MFDFHMHSRVSFDGHNTGREMAESARSHGMKAICFTDHMDYEPEAEHQLMLYDLDKYAAEYDSLEVPGIAIYRGMEFGMAPDNAPQLALDAGRRHYDFILGSVHFVGPFDVYFAPYWQGKTVWQAEREYLEHTLACVRHHDGFDVLAHLNFLSKAPAHPAPRPLPYGEHREILDEILRELVRKGKGLEMNTSGVDRKVGYLPQREFFLRFRELGGEIVTVGSDAHRPDRTGQYCREAGELLKEIFGYVCTFENRQPIFHK